MVDVTVRVSGAQGEGVESSGRIFTRVLAGLGYHVVGFRQYASVVKGNPSMYYQFRASDRRIWSHGPLTGVDVLIALNREALARHSATAKYVIHDPADGSPGHGSVPVPLTEYANKVGGPRIMRNTVALGALAALLGMDFKALEKAIRAEFGRKEEAIAEKNVQAAWLGYSHVEKHAGPIAGLGKIGEPRILMSGNEALAVGALLAGMKFYAAYPMTPASPILHFLAEHGPRYGVTVVQLEDEIACINAVIGAAFAGVRAATGTSGGGFDLMHEGISLAAMIEAPVVVFMAQRGGPSTGLPTEHEQSDLFSVVLPGHGEYPIAVVSPHTVEDALYVAARAFNIAEKWQIPVIVLYDLYLAEAVATIGDIDWGRFRIERGELVTSPVVWEDYKRYKITESGVSPRTIPGVPGGMHIATSDEHDERGDIITDRHLPEIRRAMHAKRMRKLEGMAREAEPPAVYGDGDVAVVTWGSTAMPLLDLLNDQNQGFRLVAVRDLYPMNREATLKALDAKIVIDVEVNYSGQLAEHLRRMLGVEVGKKVLKWWGEPWYVDELREALAPLLA